MVSRANNHTLDWGVEGMRETSRALNENGITHAGAGENLAEAGAARFLETARGRVALVSFATTFETMARACDPAGEAPGRPGPERPSLGKKHSGSAEDARELEAGARDASLVCAAPERCISCSNWRGSFRSRGRPRIQL